MDQPPLHLDEDQDSLFGSPPPSPARGRSPPQETRITGRETSHIIAAPSTGTSRKNVGTIALPGSHMSCAELPANLPASSLSLRRSVSSYDPSIMARPNNTGTPIPVRTPVMTSQSSTRSVVSRASSVASATPSTSTRKRRTPKSKSLTPGSPAPPITLPGPDEPTPPNFLRSQSSLLGLAGLVGCVKPAQLYANSPQPFPAQQPRPYSPICGTVPTHPIVLDDDQDTPRLEKHPCDEIQMPRCLDQLNPETLRSNIINSLTEEKNFFPVLESLVKLLGGESHNPPVNHPSQPFARPYGHGIFSVQPTLSTPPSPPGGPTTATTVPAAKRRKLKHVPAGAADWDVPFPFVTGEGPEAYHDTWARDRAKQLATQLLELVQDATKRAAMKTAKGGGKESNGHSRARICQSSRCVSVGTQTGQIGSTQLASYASPIAEAPVTGTVVDNLGHYLDLLEVPSTVGSPASSSKDRTCMNSEDTVEEVVPCDYPAFEDWLSQLEQFLPLEHNAPSPSEPDWTTRQSLPLDISASSPAPNIHIGIRDEAVDPVLLAISEPSESAPRSQSPTPTTTLTPSNIPQTLEISPTSPPLPYSPHTSLSSLTELPTPLSEAFAADVSTNTVVHRDPICEPRTHRPTEKRPADQVQTMEFSSSLTRPRELPYISAAEKGKARVDGTVASATPSSASGPSISSALVTFRGLDKQAILQRAREHRRRLVAEIERTKIELWEATVEGAALVHFTKGRSS